MTTAVTLEAVVLVASSLVACASPRQLAPATSPSIPLRCTATPLLDDALDEATLPAQHIVVALTPERAVVATRGRGRGDSRGAGSLWNIPRASNKRFTRFLVEGAAVAASRGDEVWIVFLSQRSLRFHRVEAGEHDAHSWRDFSIGYTSPDLLTTRDDGVFLLAHSYPRTEQGTPFGGLLAVDRSGVVARTDAKRRDAPYLGVVPRKRGAVVLRRAVGQAQNCFHPEWSLLFLDSRLEVEREVSASFEACKRDCQPLVTLGSEMITGCSDGALVVVDDAGHTYETALGRPIELIAALEHQLVVVTEGSKQPSWKDHEAVIESPPGTPLASFAYHYDPEYGMGFPRIATSGNDALVAWATPDAQGVWSVHARLVTCR
jgi:hypothetical protein